MRGRHCLACRSTNAQHTARQLTPATAESLIDITPPPPPDHVCFFAAPYAPLRYVTALHMPVDDVDIASSLRHRCHDMPLREFTRDYC